METAVVAFAAFLIAGFVKGVLGFGFPIIALVVLTLATGLFDALAVIVIPTLATNVVQALSGNHLSEILRRLWLYFLCALLGIFLTSFFIAEVNAHFLTALLGGVLFMYSLSRLFDMRIAVRRENEPLLSVVLGTGNGLITGFTGSFMVPSVLYMQALGFNRDMLVQAMGLYFALSTLLLAVSLGSNELLSAAQLKSSFIALLPAFLGVFVGRWVRTKIDEDQFEKVFLVSVLLLGAYIVVRSIIALQAA
jgi:uncharacterized membrane protein YfcA